MREGYVKENASLQRGIVDVHVAGRGLSARINLHRKASASLQNQKTPALINATQMAPVVDEAYEG